MKVGRPKGSLNKPKQIKAAPSEAFKTKEPVKEIPQTGTFRVGRMIGDEWGIYAYSRFGSPPVCVFISDSESKVCSVAEILNKAIEGSL